MTSDQFGSNARQDHSSNETVSVGEDYVEDASPSDLPVSPAAEVFVCIPRDGYERFFGTYIPVFDILLVAVIPFFLLCCSNIGIITYTMRSNRRMRAHRKRSNRLHQRLTIMLLSVTLAFIGLTCPSVIFICVNKILYSMRLSKEKSSGVNSSANLRESSSVQWLIEVCEALWYAKHAMNFILYTLSGQDFRREFLKLFTQCCHNRPSILKKLTNTTQTNANRTINTTLVGTRLNAGSAAEDKTITLL